MHTLFKSALFSTILSVFVLGAVALSSQSTLAATAPASRSADADTATDSANAEETTMELKRRIEKVVEEKRDQIKGIVSNVLSEKYSFIGEVTRLSQEAVTISQNGDSRILPLSEEIMIVKNGKRIAADQIEVGNWVTVLGTGSPEKFTPEILIISTKSLRPKPRTVTIGTITTMTKTSITVLPRGNQDEQTFVLPKTGKYENYDGASIKITDFDEDISVLVIATRDENDKLTLSTLRALTDVLAQDDR